MTERPILFSYAMVKALLDGRKTQTRRVVKPQPPAEAVDVGCFRSHDLATDGLWVWLDHPDMDSATPVGDEFRCRYGVPGDRLWVRETWAHVPATAYRMSPGVQQTPNPNEPDMAAVYQAGWERSRPTWRPSIHMPRWASRLQLDVINVRIERLNDCSEDDAIAEGLEWVAPGKWAVDTSLAIIGDDPRAVYRELWEHINGAGSWELNPWVWVVTFARSPDGLA